MVRARVSEHLVEIVMADSDLLCSAINYSPIVLEITAIFTHAATSLTKRRIVIMTWVINAIKKHVATSAPDVLAVAVVFPILSLVAVCLRIYVRAFMIKAMGKDDYTIILTWFLAATFAALSAWQTRYGLGIHDIRDFPIQNREMYSKVQYIAAPFYITSIFGFKLSLLFSFLRICHQRTHHIAIKCLIVACCIQRFVLDWSWFQHNVCGPGLTTSSLVFLATGLLLCLPITKIFDPSISGACVPSIPFFISMAAIIILLDILVMLTPFPILLSSQLRNRKKVAVLGLFSLGGFITVIQLIRIFTIKSLVSFLGSWPIILWSVVESNLGIVVCCIPPLSPLFKSFASSMSKGPSVSKDTTSDSGKLANLSSYSRKVKSNPTGTDLEDFDGLALLERDGYDAKQFIKLNTILVTNEVRIVRSAASPHVEEFAAYHVVVPKV